MYQQRAEHLFHLMGSASSTQAGGIMSGTLFGRTTVAVLLVALTVLGCDQIESARTGESGPGAVREPSATSQTRDGQSDSTQSDSTQPDDTPPDDGISDSDDSDFDGTQVAWVPPGPGDLFGFDRMPDELEEWYKAFRERDCDAIAALGPQRAQPQLYAGLGDACRAVLEDNDQSWPSAEVALQNVGNPTDPLDREARRLLSDLVTAHQRAPNADIRIVDPSPEDSSPPQTSVTPSPTSVTPTPTSFNSGSTSQARETPSHGPQPPAPAG